MDQDSNKKTDKSIKDAPNYPEGFQNRQSGTTKNTINNKELLNYLRQIESGERYKVYKDGYTLSDEKITLHYFQSGSGIILILK
ncbi:hypothetical protein M2475_001822 [Breznakia sp. PF5-3]|uniref:hypothetical protein n=1 Tax=unclassified Breznakia TaxID=2623764 RepID=UPI00240607B0|nr:MULTISPECIES: hypothetical protein [unclassified Breznakia]MDF9825367.1 hypothetical protein [Breznakia sp. PM6-1]MDF9836245.1 hypothetical protein [Breznakia sp. PF5-3]MDF9838515.1 hypothetical protein [Breznakia sp. PFB2-8]MDF9860490.1 hypothetical protein [Breznakia sp. PH5-24]